MHVPFLRQILATTIFQMQILEMSNGCKGNMVVHEGCRIEHSFGWKRNYRHTKYGVLLRQKIQMKIQIDVNYLMSKKCCRRGHRNRSAVSVTRITVDVGHPNQVNPHRCQSPKLPQNVRFHQTPRSQNDHKTIEVEF